MALKSCVLQEGVAVWCSRLHECTLTIYFVKEAVQKGRTFSTASFFRLVQ